MSIIKILSNLSIIYILVLIVVNFKILRQSKHVEFILMLFSSLFANIGYFWLSYAKDLSEAIVAQKLVYIAAFPMMYFILVLVIDICNIGIDRRIVNGLGLITVCAIGLSLTIGYNDVFYKSVEISHDGIFCVLTKEYGWGHTVTSLLMMFYMISSVGFAIYAITRPKLSARSHAIILALSETITLIAYFMYKIVDLKIELVPFCNCVSMTCALMVLKKQYIYDASRAAQKTAEIYHDSGILAFDMDKRFMSSNATAEGILPQIKEYKLGCVLPESSNGVKYFYPMIDELIANPKEAFVETFFDKGDLVYRLRVRKLYEDEHVEKQKGFIVEIIDDTEQQNYLRKMQRLNFDLESAIEDAQSANAAKSNFLANMSHEIRTPINAVLGLNSIILRDSKEEKTLEYATDIQNAGNALLSLINDILDFSKIEAGKMDIIPDRYSISSLVNDCQNMIFVKIADKNLKFEIENDEKLPFALKGDEVRIRQICINLLNNAVKYTDTGKVKLSIGFRPLSDSMITLIISVSDTGQGISEENQKHLFESFKRINEMRNKNIEGTGLGLSLVKELTDLMGGDVFVQSTIGEGSTFTVELPQLVLDKTPMGKFEKTVQVKEAVQKMDDLKDVEGDILVVDDVPMNLKVIKHLLKISKLRMDTAESGLEAIAKVKEKKYDIIFLDHMMPGMDGIETLHQMKALNRSKNIDTPVVMLTANAIEGVKEQYITEGFDDYLSKPVGFEAIRDVILKFI